MRNVVVAPGHAVARLDDEGAAQIAGYQAPIPSGPPPRLPGDPAMLRGSNSEPAMHSPHKLSRIKKVRKIGFRARMRTRKGRATPIASAAWAAVSASAPTVRATPEAGSATPSTLVLIGLRGSGKTTLCCLLAAALGSAFIARHVRRAYRR